jgi:DNA invertase Pin-like site-specific DNA recombinase
VCLRLPESPAAIDLYGDRERKRAKVNGVRFGRPRKLTPHQTREALKRVNAGEPLRQIALSFNVDHSTISRLKTQNAAEFD